MSSEIDQNKPIVIVGAGMTGLACAYFLKQTGRPIHIIEKANEAGGLLSTFEHKGYHLEKFYHHFFNEDAELKYLIDDLGIRENFIAHQSSVGHEYRGKMYPFTTASDLLHFKPLTFINRLRFGVSSLLLGKLMSWKKHHQTAAYTWFIKYAGKQATDVIWEPMMRGKFSSCYKDIPLSWFIGRLKQRMSSRKNSGEEKLYYIKGSIKTLINALIKHLKEHGVSIHYNDNITFIEKHKENIQSIHCKSDLTFKNPYLILTCPTQASADIIETIDQNLAQTLRSIDYYHAHCMVLILKQKLSPAYWLNITKPDSPFIGIIEHTNWIPSTQYNNDHIVYLTKYSLSQDPLTSMPEADIKDLFLNKLQDLFPNYNFKNNLQHTFLFHSKTAAPVCTLGFDQTLKTCKSSIKNMHLAMMPQVYPDERSVNNSIRIAYNTCVEAGFSLKPLPQGNNIAAQIF